jgi:hypothetical protein
MAADLEMEEEGVDDGVEGAAPLPDLEAGYGEGEGDTQMAVENDLYQQEEDLVTGR